MSKRIVNIINFIRGCEPRSKNDSYLAETTINQIRQAKEFGFPVTWLIQYDAMQHAGLVEVMKKELDATHEIGIWLEIVQGLVEKAGLKWRGRHPWDWHANVGFSIGYTPAEREQLIDAFMAEFKKVWGRHPDSVGCWFIDAHTLAYLQGKYGLAASCNCREQFGTDGYGLWGGYWSGAYYPSKKNSLLPGQTVAGQIPVPIFRMLGSDPIYQYASEIEPANFYEGYGGAGRTQDIITLEPAPLHPDCGGSNQEWIRWFFRNNFSEPVLSLGYAQVGQENSMGWDAIKAGLTEQFRQLKTLREQGVLTIQTLAESGRQFKRQFQVSPPTAVCCLEDWKQEHRAAVWYMSRFQRLGFLVDDNQLYLRDWQLYDENYPEPYLNTQCHETHCLYDAMPIMDGFRWRAPGKGKGKLREPFRTLSLPSSIGFRLEGGPGRIVQVTEKKGLALSIEWHDQLGTTMITCSEEKLCFYFPNDRSAIKMIFDSTEPEGTSLSFSGSSVKYRHGDFLYELEVVSGLIEPDARLFHADGNNLQLKAKRA